MPAPRNSFKAALKEGRAQIGLWLALTSAYAAEICGGAGYDWLLIDAEHAPNDIQTLVAQLQGLAKYPVHPIIRPPIGEAWIIKQILDIGAQTILVPMVETREQAEASKEFDSAARMQMRYAVQQIVLQCMQEQNIDAVVYPTSPRPATPITPKEDPKPGVGGDSPTNLANESGCPDLIVPAGMTPEGLPVTISFFGPQWSEPKLIGYAYDFEQATKAIRLPKTTPALPTDTLSY